MTKGYRESWCIILLHDHNTQNHTDATRYTRDNNNNQRKSNHRYIAIYSEYRYIGTLIHVYTQTDTYLEPDELFSFF